MAFKGKKSKGFGHEDDGNPGTDGLLRIIDVQNRVIDSLAQALAVAAAVTEDDDEDEEEEDEEEDKEEEA
jgi:hypothetical protein